ncbi:ABC-2 transporter permease [Nesterenkonia ebinurensis]|uniref:ABC-2 transporter permease n=1 Tax=Nesterenkonia ebinurensis TaxID=2608252 RepID=UPI00123E0DCB|nr:ABC-2 transporter permease [Nesterenkonia ebinurensis]
MSTITLLRKEVRLFLPPTYLLTAALTLFNLIPHYPMIIGASYFILALFIAFSEANANKDHEFTIALPVSRNRVVLAKHLSVAALELVQFAALAIVAVFAALITPDGNVIGMDGNYAFFGLVLVSAGLFNVIFLPGYFSTGYKTGRSGVLAAITFFVSYGIFELLINVIPGASDVLDTLDPADAGLQLVVLAIGAVAYLVLTATSYRLSVGRFDRVNL